MIALLALMAAPADFNGRWNLTVANEPRARAWWLEVEGAGTPGIKGRFVGAPGGQLDAIPRISIQSDELVWEFERVKGIYRARLVNGSLQGFSEVPGRPRMTFTGKRAPVLKAVDDGKWKPGTPVELFNGRDLAGWECRVPGKRMEWRVDNGLMKNGDKAADITSTRTFFDFKLHVEFRVAQKSNSGIGLRGRYEVQIFGDHGEPPSIHGNGALYSRIAPAVNATKAPGEWQVFDITLVGRQVTVVLNGKTLIDRKEIEGLTAMATSAGEDQPGPITLQGDHGPVEFRGITVTPLTR